mgnify:CR=1 FL=1
MSVRRHYLGLALLLMIATGAALAASAILFAQERSHMDHAHHMHGADAVTPTRPGQEAFGTIQEIVRILEANPATDWSKADQDPVVLSDCRTQRNLSAQGRADARGIGRGARSQMPVCVLELDVGGQHFFF